MITGLSPEQQAVRMTGITGTDIPKLAGLSDYGGEWDVWLRLKGLADDPVINASGTRNPAEWGNRLQQLIADRRMEDLAPGHELIPQTETRRHPAKKWMLATLDYVIRGPLCHWDLECKAPGLRQAWKFGRPNTGADEFVTGADGAILLDEAGVPVRRDPEIPGDYLVQVAWQLAVTDLHYAEVAVLIGGQDYRLYRVRRDAEFEADLIENAERFWRDHILADKPPKPEASDGAERYYKSFARLLGPPMTRASERAEEWADKLRLARDIKARAEKAEQLARVNLMCLTGASGGIEGDGWRGKWQDVKASEYVVNKPRSTQFVVRFARGDHGTTSEG